MGFTLRKETNSAVRHPSAGSLTEAPVLLCMEDFLRYLLVLPDIQRHIQNIRLCKEKNSALESFIPKKQKE